MESNMQGEPKPLNPTEGATATARATSDSGHTRTNKAGKADYTELELVKELSTELIDKVKLKAGKTYDQANKKVGKQYEKAIDYGRDNLGITTLIVFGVGVSIGALLVSNFRSSRDRRSHMAESTL